MLVGGYSSVAVQVPSMSEALSLIHVTWCLTFCSRSREVRQRDEKLVQSTLATRWVWGQMGYETVINKVQPKGSTRSNLMAPLTPHFSCQPIAWRAADEPLLISLTLTRSRFLLHPLTVLLPDPHLHILQDYPLFVNNLRYSRFPWITLSEPHLCLALLSSPPQCCSTVNISISESLSFPTFSVPSAQRQPHQVGFPVVSKCPSLLFVHKYTL